MSVLSRLRRPRLRTALLAYFFALHVLFAGAAIYFLRERPLWLLLVELLFILSLIAGWRLVRAFFVPLELIGTGADMIEEEEFTIHFRNVSQPEFDRLLEIYNSMVDRLHDERVRIEEQNELLDRVIDASPGGVVVCDLDGRISAVNPAAREILSVGSDTLIGTSPDEHPVLSQSDENRRSRVVSVRAGRRIRCTRTEFRDRGFVRHLYLVEELTEELRASEKDAYGQLIRLISHEVNNSVGPVSSLVDTIRYYGDRLETRDRQRFESGLDLAAQRLDHLRDFVEGFADVVKLPPPNKAPCDLDRVLDDVVEVMRPLLDERGLTVEWEKQEALGVVEVDKNQFEQVLINVIRNAVEACPDGGSISVRTQARDDKRCLEIADSGIGLSPEVQQRLFRPFFSTKSQGRGLGLTLVNEILSRHAFAFSLDNGRDHGAVFRIELNGAPRGGTVLARGGTG